MTSIVLGILIIVVVVCLAVGGLILVRRLVPAAVLAENHEVAAAMLGTLGTLYAIVLGLVVVEALNRRASAELQESIEASNLIDVSMLTRGLPPRFRFAVLEAEYAYCKQVVDQEWPALARGITADPSGGQEMVALWGAVDHFEPQTMRQQNVHAEMLNAVVRASEARRQRAILSQGGLPWMLWLSLIVGGICTISFTYLFAPRHIKVQVVMTSVITLVFCLNLLLVLYFSRPYFGETQIRPTNFKRALNGLEHRPILRNRGVIDENDADSKESEAPQQAADQQLPDPQLPDPLSPQQQPQPQQ